MCIINSDPFQRVHHNTNKSSLVVKTKRRAVSQWKMNCLFLLTADIDECATNTDNCDAKATCDNFIGGYSCTCLPGYTGDGFTCAGIFYYNWLKKPSKFKIDVLEAVNNNCKLKLQNGKISFCILAAQLTSIQLSYIRTNL